MVFDLISADEEEQEEYPDTKSKPNQLAGKSVLGMRPWIKPTATALPSTQTPLIQQNRNGENKEDGIPFQRITIPEGIHPGWGGSEA